VAAVACGIFIRWPHLPHLAVRPASSSFTLYLR
jgi:hypothetical protein